MNTDEGLRDRIAGVDPAAGATAPDVLDRIITDESAPPRRTHPGRIALLAIAAVAIIGLIGAVALPRLFWTSVSNIATTTQSAPVEDTAVSLQDAGTQESGAAAAPESTTATEESRAIIRTAAVLSATKDPQAAADRYVQVIRGMDGQVVSQTVVTQDSAGATMMDDGDMGPSMMGGERANGSDRGGMPMMYPAVPGVWLTVQVPADRYDEALAAARQSGQVVRLEQSADDVTAQRTDVEARIKALESSLTQLRALMQRARSVSDVIAVEQAIAERQLELDALRAQQRDLQSATDMSRISLTLVAPDDAATLTGDDTGSGTAFQWILGAIVIAVAVVGGVWAWSRGRRQQHPAP